jgi:hypothetical protein
MLLASCWVDYPPGVYTPVLLNREELTEGSPFLDNR